MAKIFSILLVSTLVVTTLLGHEYILFASNYQVKKGDSLDLHLFVADGFNIEAERTYINQITRKFELLTNRGLTNLKEKGKENALPFSTINIDFEGLGLFYLERDYAKISLDPQKFREYLKEDHLENISIASAETKPQRERYSRYIKCLVQSDQLKNDSLHKAIVGQAFEIVLLQNPYNLKTGDFLPVKVLFQGEPLKNKIITARNRTGNASAIVQTSRTNHQGICSFQITRKGDWVVHVTHMIPCPDKTEADWESFWASYSFGIN